MLKKSSEKFKQLHKQEIYTTYIYAYARKAIIPFRLEPYSYFNTPVSDFHFTNTYSPITNITLNSCGDRTNGEDDFLGLLLDGQ